MAVAQGKATYPCDRFPQGEIASVEFPWLRQKEKKELCTSQCNSQRTSPPQNREQMGSCTNRLHKVSKCSRARNNISVPMSSLVPVYQRNGGTARGNRLHTFTAAKPLNTFYIRPLSEISKSFSIITVI